MIITRTKLTIFQSNVGAYCIRPCSISFLLKLWEHQVLGRMQYAPTHFFRITYFIHPIFEDVEKI